jgi:hypothetical protein
VAVACWLVLLILFNPLKLCYTILFVLQSLYTEWREHSRFLYYDHWMGHIAWRNIPCNAEIAFLNIARQIPRQVA